MLNSSFGAIAEALGGGEEAIGFFDNSSGFSIAEYSAALPGYDLAGSATVAGFLGITSLVPEATSSGALVISALDAPGAAFYTATVTPEPGTFALFGTGLFGLAGVLRRRRARRLASRCGRKMSNFGLCSTESSGGRHSAVLSKT